MVEVQASAEAQAVFRPSAGPEGVSAGSLYFDRGFEYPGTGPSVFRGWEALFVAGGVGKSTVTCCDEKLNRKTVSVRSSTPLTVERRYRSVAWGSCGL